MGSVVLNKAAYLGKEYLRIETLKRRKIFFCNRIFIGLQLISS